VEKGRRALRSLIVTLTLEAITLTYELGFGCFLDSYKAYYEIYKFRKTYPMKGD
jgi:hypothetical protein